LLRTAEPPDTGHCKPGFIGAATQRAGLPLPIIIAALLPLELALRGVRRS
jgi:hypothetical protein